MSTDTLKGHAVKGAARPSKNFGEGRACAAAGCITKLSKYNKRDHCHAHAPVRYPRVRGRILPEGT